ncbi:hypothetical protein LDENG_00238540 [Lucifuga dentata]|nr:hypothetical protein LDENG_00238540 [Lucifuga dentata]
MKRQRPTTQSIQRWTNGTVSALHGCFNSMHWNIFREVADDDITEYMEGHVEWIENHHHRLIKEDPALWRVATASLVDELNTFYAHFEVNTPPLAIGMLMAQASCPLEISRLEVWKALKRINPRKAPGPDSIPGQFLKACADALADVITHIFNLFLAQRHGGLEA